MNTHILAPLGNEKWLYEIFAVKMWNVIEVGLRPHRKVLDFQPVWELDGTLQIFA